MLLSSVVIILREVLEGALLISVLLSLSWHREMTLRWSWVALLFGFLGAFVYAYEFEQISMWFDYVGQEIVNASLHVVIVIFLTGFALLDQIYEKNYEKTKIILMALAASLTIVREGSEILLYLSGYLTDNELLPSALLGGIIGAGIGLSLGALLYYALTYFIPVYARKVAYFLLALFAAGMLSQAVTMLTQADWLPPRHILWDTSAWLEESSLLGQLLYAIMGYEATPTAIQLTAYVIGILLLLILPKFFKRIVGLNANNK